MPVVKEVNRHESIPAPFFTSFKKSIPVSIVKLLQKKRKELLSLMRKNSSSSWGNPVLRIFPKATF
jgi:hypothetical protein